LIRHGLWDDGPEEGSLRMLFYDPDWRPTEAM
jgi:hypothetical protein